MMHLKDLAMYSSHSALDPQANEPTYPTVVPAMDFDPDRDAARIETAIKTKGKTQYCTCC